MQDTPLPDTLIEGNQNSPELPPPRANLQPLEIRGDEYVLFALPHLDHSRRPVVSLGKSPKTGKLQLHFRVYAKNGRVKSARWDITQAGCTLSPAEFDDVARKIDELTPLLPELAEARRRAS